MPDLPLCTIQKGIKKLKEMEKNIRVDLPMVNLS